MRGISNDNLMTDEKKYKELLVISPKITTDIRMVECAFISSSKTC